MVWNSGGRRVRNNPMSGYQEHESLKGWDYILDPNDGKTVICAYKERGKELRINPDLESNFSDIEDDLRTGCLPSLVRIGTLGWRGRGVLSDDFDVRIGVGEEEEVYSYDKGLKIVRLLTNEQKSLVGSKR